jgi:excisionase family DNA binding protein
VAARGREGEGGESAMSTLQLERLHKHCRRLQLFQIEHELTTRLEQAAKKELSYADFLDELLAAEVGAKTPEPAQSRSRLPTLEATRRVLTLRQVAAYLRVHRNTVYRLVMDNQLPAFKVGHCWRFDSERIDHWLLEREQTMKSTPYQVVQPPKVIEDVHQLAADTE